tara:strand:- start:542 stop:1303 length:762 start_codon:yes stop_codon:yes gene_type:complete
MGILKRNMNIFRDSSFRDLEKLNFTVNESKVYLTLLKIGPSMAGAIAKEAKLDRSSTYNALKLLTERGIVSTIHETKRSIYVPSNPKKILDYFQEKEEIAKRIIPSLEQQYKTKKEKGSFLFFQGYKGLKTVFQDILDNVGKNEEYLVMSSEGLFTERMPYYAPIFRKRKLSKKIKTKMLLREDREKKTKSKHTEYRKLPSDVISPASINIYDGKVAIFMWKETPEAILIEDKDVSQTFKNYFNFIWKNAKKV